ncbi:MAG: UDP-N-acetylglucosamine pyrophosphorylase [Thermodesulfobacteriota bacterium]|nr:UDP-N-acetylglucosamine pyrophosphorylase [Thermodesulfobacteriota bacterium]
MNDRVHILVDKGVLITNPSSVDIGKDVDLEKISPGVTIYPGCRIYGSNTLIMGGTKLGQESPATIQDCQIGSDVELKGGSFKKSVFLDRSTMASGAHVRDACILEEEASGGHTVGIKQTVLMPFVTLGSLINLCDCFMAGGTSRKDHSEVGSSYIHFNYTPNQDKATASLFGDVPRGVMLDQSPIFLGGQGGIVGPSMLGFGTIIAAGTVFRGDLPGDGKIVIGQDTKAATKTFIPGVYWEIKRKTHNNILYIANLIALKAWYRHIRSMFFGPSAQEQALFTGLMEKCDLALDERIKRLGALAKKMDPSIDAYQKAMGPDASIKLVQQKKALSSGWDKLEETLQALRSTSGEDAKRDAFIQALVDAGQSGARGYISTIRGLPQETRTKGTAWLNTIVKEVETTFYKMIPSMR